MQVSTDITSSPIEGPKNTKLEQQPIGRRESRIGELLSRSLVLRNSTEDFLIFSDLDNQVEAIRPDYYYRLPSSSVAIANKDFSELELSETKRNFPLAQFTQPLRTRRIFRDSERFFGNDLIASNKANFPLIREKVNNQNPNLSVATRFRRASSRIANTKFLENHSYPIRSNSRKLVKRFFEFDKASNSLKPRSSGLKLALKIYLDQLKTFQPYLYEICLQAAHKINEQNPERANPQAICTISVHQSETKLPKLLQELEAQDFDKTKCPIYLFVNGNDQAMINTRLNEIEEFKKANPDLDLRVIAAELDDWRYGLKCIPLITALMSLALRPCWDNDQDIATILFDADIERFHTKHTIKTHIAEIHSGKIISSGGGQITLPGEHMAYYIMNLIRKSWDIILAINQGFAFDKVFENFMTKGLNCSGGNSALSTIMLVLGCGTAAHSCNEDTDLGYRTSSNIIRAFEPEIRNLARIGLADALNDIDPENNDLVTEKRKQCMSANFYQRIIPVFSSPINYEVKSVFYDSGAMFRAIETCRPLTDMWDNHDYIQGKLTPTDFSDRTTTLKRFEEELQDIMAKTFELYKKDIANLGIFKSDVFGDNFRERYKELILKDAIEPLLKFFKLYHLVIETNFDFENGFTVKLVPEHEL